jgi:nucleoside-diphosphate-sugar epimerase
VQLFHGINNEANRMRLLVTGDSGLVGAGFTDLCRSNGIEVVGFDLRGEQRQDIREARSLDAALSDVDGVVHLAAVSRVAWGELDPTLCNSVNVEGTQQVLRAIERTKAGIWLLFASSREVYGNPKRQLVRETDPLLPVNVYGRSKLLGEQLVAEARLSGLQAAVLRLSNVYGNQRDHPDRAVPALAAKAVRGETLQITGGKHYFDFVHVRDVAEGLLRAVHQLQDGRMDLPPLHLATGIATSLSDLAELAVAVAGASSLIEEIGAREFDVGGFCGDPAAAAQTLGWEASIRLADGLAMVVEDIRQNGTPEPAWPFGPHG